MKKNFTILLLLSFLISISVQQSLAQLPDSWLQKNDFGGVNRLGSVGFSIGTKGYIGTGSETGKLKDFWEYDASNDTWSQKSSFGGSAREYASGFSIGTKGYIGCGDDGVLTKDFWEYDPSTNTWTQKADFAGNPRKAATAFSIGLKGYLGTGLIDAVTRVNDFWEYDQATDTWTQKADFGGSTRAYAVGFSIGNKGYIGTGNHPGILEKDFWEYNSNDDTWTQKADFGGAGRFQAIGIGTGAYGYIGLGDTGGGYNNDFWEYSQVLDTWTKKADFGGQARILSTGFNIANIVYVGIGYDAINVIRYKDFWEYTPSCIPPTISTEPVSQSISYGASASFSVLALDADTYQWQEDSGSGFVDIPDGGIYSNTTTNTLDISLPDVAMTGYKYRCVVTGDCLLTATTDGNASLTVTALDILVTPDASQTKVFGALDPTPFTYTFAPALVGADVMSGLMDRVTGEDAGDYAFTLGTLTAGANYNLTVEATPTFSITALQIVITPDADQTKVFGTSDPTPFTYTYAPALVGTDVISGLMERVAGEDVGDYTFTLGTLTAGTNYALTVVATPIFSITALQIVITPDADQTKVFGTSDPTPFTYTYAPALVGADVISGLMERVAGEDVGDYGFTIGTLTAGTNYELTVAATPIFSITALQIVITPDADQTKDFGTSDPTPFTYTYAPALVGADVISGLMERVAGEDVGDYEFSIGTLTAGTNYELTVTATPTFSITALQIVITPDANQTKVYGTSDPTPFTYTYAPALVGADVISGLMERVAGEDVGDYAFTIGTLSAGTNYIFNVASSPTFSITGIALTITAEDKEKCYDGAIYSDAYTVTFSGFVNNEDENVLGGLLVFGGTSASATTAGNYSIDPSGLTSSNYIISFVNGTLVIKPTPATPTITRSGDSLISNVANGNQWYMNGIEMPGWNGQVHVADTNSIYYTVVTENGCSSAPSNSINVLDVSIKEALSEIFDIYPNPSNGNFNIKIKKANTELYTIEIYNNLGILIWKENNALIEGNNVKMVDMKGSASGFYTVILKNKAHSFVKKMLINK